MTRLSRVGIHGPPRMVPPIEAADAVRRSVTAGDGPVNPGNLVDLWPDLRVSKRRLDNSGYLLDYGSGADILVRSGDPHARQRFTLAHEIGHWLLNEAVPRVHEPGSARRPFEANVERWCDEFAAHLLMPVAAFDLLEDDEAMLRMVDSLPSVFGVSSTVCFRQFVAATRRDLLVTSTRSGRVAVRGFGGLRLSRELREEMVDAHADLTNHTKPGREVVRRTRHLVVVRRRGLGECLALRTGEDVAQRDPADVRQVHHPVEVDQVRPGPERVTKSRLRALEDEVSTVRLVDVELVEGLGY